jgi:hypothetical protein
MKRIALAFGAAAAAISAWVLATVVAGTVGFLWVPTAATNGTVQMNVTVPGYVQSMNILRPAGTITAAVFMFPGATGDNVSFCQNVSLCQSNPVNYAITNAVWSSQYGGSTTLTLSPQGADPSVIIVPGRNINISGVTCTGSAGACFNGTSIPVISVSSYQVVIAQAAAVSPGTFVSGGTLQAQQITADKVNWLIPQGYHTEYIIIQPNAPLGVDNGCNPVSFQGSIIGNVLTMNTSTSGKLQQGQTVTGSGIPANTTVTALGTGTGYEGTYLLSWTAPSPISNETMAATGVNVAPTGVTFCNLSMNSGLDDPSFVLAATQYIHNNDGISYSFMMGFGHSNGGFLLNRLLSQYANYLALYGIVSGPKPTYFLHHNTTPTTYKKIWQYVGGYDQVLCGDPSQPGCQGTLTQFIGSISGTTLTVSNLLSGTITPGNKVEDIQLGGVAAGTTILSQINSTQYLLNVSQNVSQRTLTTNGIFDATYVQNISNASKADISYPLPQDEIGMTYTTAQEANGLCGLSLPQPLSISDATITAVNKGYLISFSYCNDGIELNIDTEGQHSISSQESVLGYRLLAKFMSWAKAQLGF